MKALIYGARIGNNVTGLHLVRGHTLLSASIHLRMVGAGVGTDDGALVGGSVGAEVGSGVGSPAAYVGVIEGATEGGAVPVLVRMTANTQCKYTC
jgi:outer membrane lipoprotein SlyB